MGRRGGARSIPAITAPRPAVVNPNEHVHCFCFSAAAASNPCSGFSSSSGAGSGGSLALLALLALQHAWGGDDKPAQFGSIGKAPCSLGVPLALRPGRLLPAAPLFSLSLVRSAPRRAVPCRRALPPCLAAVPCRRAVPPPDERSRQRGRAGRRRGGRRGGSASSEKARKRE